MPCDHINIIYISGFYGTTKIFLEVIILYPTPDSENVISIYFNKTTENCAYFGILKTLQKGMILSYRHQLLKRTVYIDQGCQI
jgi:hypothetical protein